ncbi:hypothetical protein INQ51_14895 [Maribellus sp. CM-23]|uniref:hypothetical protein n=1 Tax=Maribellus sp. CM-23 TaxID=2781026 RepID=UPI001F3907D1|nr:hypothetical protein [Maribellus sp. CM-23]MCE4565605.1 hypothetical protein [Maribellus sp. CM-23]
MKRIFSLSLILYTLVVFSSCNTTEVSTTTLSVKVPVEVTDTTSTATKSEQAGYSFSQSLTESLEEDENVNEFLGDLKSLKVEDFYVKFSGLQSSQSIDSIDISIEGIGVIATLENIASSNPPQQPEINSSILVLIGNILRSEQELTVLVSGTTNSAPMNFVVETYFVLKIETNSP